MSRRLVATVIRWSHTTHVRLPSIFPCTSALSSMAFAFFALSSSVVIGSTVTLPCKVAFLLTTTTGRFFQNSGIWITPSGWKSHQ
ncbi:hypothetical protein D3C72_2395110 [compost metagenome]